LDEAEQPLQSTWQDKATQTVTRANAQDAIKSCVPNPAVDSFLRTSSSTLNILHAAIIGFLLSQYTQSVSSLTSASRQTIRMCACRTLRQRRNLLLNRRLQIDRNTATIS